MADFGSRRGEANLGLPLMLLTFLLLGGFMYWLYATAEPTQPAVAEVVEEEPAEAMAGVAVSPEDLKTGVDAYVGQVVHLDGVAVSNLMGRAFFVDLPASDALPATPFLARLGPDLAAAGTTVAVGDMTNVGGMLLEMTDSIVNDWETNGVISSADRLLVEFATHFIEVDDLEITGGEGAPAGS